MTPAERLLKAAEILEKRANEAMPGPWAAAGRDGEWERPIVMETLTENEADPDIEGQNFVVAEMRHGYTWDADARYIATMHPEVGKAVAALLGHAGRLLAAKEDVYQLAADAGRENFDGFFGYSLTLADLVLAGEQGQEDQ